MDSIFANDTTFATNGSSAVRAAVRGRQIAAPVSSVARMDWPGMAEAAELGSNEVWLEVVVGRNDGVCGQFSRPPPPGEHAAVPPRHATLDQLTHSAQRHALRSCARTIGQGWS